MLDRVRLVLVIHDELVYEVEEGMVGEAAPVIKEAMENVLARSCLEYKSPIPLAVHEGVGDNLGEVK